MRDVLALPLAAILLALGADHALACQPPRSFYEMGRLINTDWRRARSADGRHTALAAPAIRNDALALIIYRGNEWIKDYAVSDLVTDNEVCRPGLSSGMCRPKGLWFQSLSFNEDSSHFVIETSDHEFIEIDAGSGIVTKREDIPIFPVSLSIVTTGGIRVDLREARLCGRYPFNYAYRDGITVRVRRPGHIVDIPFLRGQLMLDPPGDWGSRYRPTIRLDRLRMAKRIDLREKMTRPVGTMFRVEFLDGSAGMFEAYNSYQGGQLICGLTPSSSGASVAIKHVESFTVTVPISF